jgi:hypothetical protein
LLQGAVAAADIAEGLEQVRVVHSGLYIKFDSFLEVVLTLLLLALFESGHGLFGVDVSADGSA